MEQQSDDVRVPEPSVRVQFVTAAARRPNALDGHRSRCPAADAAGRQHRPVNGAERAAVQHGDVREL